MFGVERQFENGAAAPYVAKLNIVDRLRQQVGIDEKRRVDVQTIATAPRHRRGLSRAHDYGATELVWAGCCHR